MRKAEQDLKLSSIEQIGSDKEDHKSNMRKGKKRSKGLKKGKKRDDPLRVSKNSRIRSSSNSKQSKKMKFSSLGATDSVNDSQSEGRDIDGIKIPHHERGDIIS